MESWQIVRFAPLSRVAMWSRKLFRSKALVLALITLDVYKSAELATFPELAQELLPAQLMMIHLE
jgi:hypothetical protein